MNNPNPFVPRGSLLEKQSQRRSRLKIAVFCVLGVTVTGLVAMLIQGCKREAPEANNPPPDTTPMVDNTNFPAPDTNVVMAPPAMPVPTNVMAPPPVAMPPGGPAPMQAPVTPVPLVPAPTETAAAGGTYEVAAGDTLAKIAKSQGVTLAALEAANPGVNPKKLKVKQKLNLPGKTGESVGTSAAPTSAAPEAGGETYVVKSGDTLSKIAKKHGVTLKALRAANPKIASTDHIHVGDKLTIPGKGETATAPAPALEPLPAPVVPPVPAPTTVPAPAPAPGQ